MRYHFYGDDDDDDQHV